MGPAVPVVLDPDGNGVWVHDLGDIQRRETALCARLPTLTVTDRIVGLHTAKRMGHLLDEERRRTGVQPVSPW
ncbi:hypothetical protein [Streptomyces sp. NPDC057580]|uniref:hypothetical protein n=1 Tax=Streptomyces sp. NPDC057580 TaxID=3346173 RepID=UPI003693DC23